MAERYARLVMPEKRFNPAIGVRAYDLPGEGRMSEKVAYLRGLISGPSPFKARPPDLTSPMNIGLLREELKRRAQPVLQEALARRRSMMGAQ